MSAPAIPTFDEFSRKQANVPTFDEFSKGAPSQLDQKPSATFNGPVARAIGKVGDFGARAASSFGSAVNPINIVSGMTHPIENFKSGFAQTPPPPETAQDQPTSMIGRIRSAMGGTPRNKAIIEQSNQQANANIPEIIGTAGALALMSKAPEGVQRIRGMIPSAERAGANFQRVMAAAKDQPIDTSAAGDAALRAHELGEAGASGPPKVLSKFLKRTTEPGSSPMTFEEGRDFQSNAGRLSAKESMASNPQMKAQVSALAKALADANQAAAERAGVGDVYKDAMNEYRRAIKIQGIKDTTGEFAKSTAAKYIAGAALGAGGVAAYHAFK